MSDNARSAYAEVLHRRLEREPATASPIHDFNWLLGLYGPYFDKDVADAEVFERLDEFGSAVWKVERNSEREFACQKWETYLRKNIDLEQPRRMVDQVTKAGQRQHETQKLAATNGNARWYLDTELAELPPTVDLVSGHLPAEGVVLFYGPSGHGKTHLLLDIAQSIATGQPWHGHRVQQGPVAYVIAEGIGGLARRVDAWKSFHEWTEATGVRFWPCPVHLLEPTEAAAFLADLLTWDPPPVLVVLDTLAWCMAPGDENSTRDMSAFVAVIGELRSTLHATVALVHHTGHDTSRERGSTALAAACDTVVQVKEEDGRIVVTCTKQREAPPFRPLRFRLKQVAGTVVPELAIETSGSDGLTPKQRQALKVLQNVTVEGEGSTTSVWYESAGLPHNTFYSARRVLISMGLVRIEKRRNFPEVSNGQYRSTDEVPF